MPTCPNCGREFVNGYFNCCSRSCDQAWTLKKASTAANVASALELQKQTKIMQEQQARQQAAALADIAEKKAIADAAAKKCGFSGAEEALYWQEQAGPGADFEAAIKAKKDYEEYEKWEREQTRIKLQNREKAREESQKLLSDDDKKRYAQLVKLCSKYDTDSSILIIFLIILFPIAIIILRNFIPFLHHYKTSYLLFTMTGVSIIGTWIIMNLKLNNFVKKVMDIKKGSNSPFLYINDRAICFTCQNAQSFNLLLPYGIALVILPNIARMIYSTAFNVISIIGFILAAVIGFIKVDSNYKIIDHFAAKRAFDKFGLFIGDYDDFYDWIEGKLSSISYEKAPKTRYNFLPLEKDDDFIEKYGYLTKSKVLYRKFFEEKNAEELDKKTKEAIKKFHDEMEKNITCNALTSLVTYKEYHECIDLILGKDYEDIGHYAKVYLKKIKDKFSYVDDDTKKIFLDIQAKYKNKAEETMEKYENLPITEENKGNCCNIIRNLCYDCGHEMSNKSSKIIYH